MHNSSGDLMPQIFVSHSKYDKEFCNNFDSACASVGLERFRSEFENIGRPAWKTINREIKKSTALFLLIGKEVVNRQSAALNDNSTFPDWLFTQNWISYEIGVASQRGIDVWVLCDLVPINFPVPYLNNYDISGINLENPDYRSFIYTVLNLYKLGFPLSLNKDLRFSCPKPHCGATYNLWTKLPKGSQIICPTCLNNLPFPDGWLLGNISPFSVTILSKLKRMIKKKP